LLPLLAELVSLSLARPAFLPALFLSFFDFTP
jgi:hypothetical protein